MGYIKDKTKIMRDTAKCDRKINKMRIAKKLAKARFKHEAWVLEQEEKLAKLVPPVRMTAAEKKAAAAK